MEGSPLTCLAGYVLYVYIRKAHNTVNSIDLFHYLNVSYSMLSQPYVYYKLGCRGNSNISGQNRSNGITSPFSASGN